jgi:hypothetical protein
LAINQTWCHVLGTQVTCVSDLEDNIVQVICPHYDDATRGCRVRAAVLTGGPLAQLLERVSENTLASHDRGCVLA